MVLNDLQHKKVKKRFHGLTFSNFYSLIYLSYEIQRYWEAKRDTVTINGNVYLVNNDPKQIA
jgi:catabolite regulation protein CreA